MSKLRLAIITDIHYGPDAPGKFGTRALSLMRAFAKALKKRKNDAVIDLGDRISAISRDEDIKGLNAVAKEFNKMACPIYAAMGNHDAINLSRKDNRKRTNSPAGNYSLDMKGYHLVFLNPGEDCPRELLAVTPNDMKWLKKDLAATDKPTIIISHVPLNNFAEQSVSKVMQEFFNKHNADISQRLGYTRRGKELRKIIEQSGKVFMVLSGHLHKSSHTEINGIHHITQNSLIEDNHSTGSPSKTFGFLEIDGKNITYKLKGRGKKTIKLKSLIAP